MAERIRNFAEVAHAAFTQGLHGRRVDIDIEESDRAFIEKWGLQVDGRPYDFVAYPHTASILEDDHDEIVIMGAAQGGKTVKLLPRMIRDALRWPGAFVSGYWPTQDLAREVSAERFAKMLRSSPALYRKLRDATIGGLQFKEREGMDVRTLAGSTILFKYTGPPGSPALTTTESTPVRSISFDELRKMDGKIVDLALKRCQAWTDYRRFFCSTAGAPGVDIDQRFQAGDQRYWHSACGCADGCVLALAFPDCIEDLRRASFQRVAQVRAAFDRSPSRLPLYGLVDKLAERFANVPACYTCPTCGEVIADPRLGWWEEHAPGAYAHSYQMPAFLSPAQPAPRVLVDVELATDKGGVMRDIVGRPYLDEGDIFVKEADLMGSLSADARWWARESGGPAAAPYTRRAAGVDVQQGYLVLVILGLVGQGQLQVQHLEIVHDPDIERGDENKRTDRHWIELVRRLVEWNVKICVIDQMPEPSRVSELQQRARAMRAEVSHGLTVYAASYQQLGGTQGGGPMITWGDERDDTKERGAGTTTRWQVALNRTTAHEVALARWRRRLNQMPDPNGLQQRLPVNAKGEVELRADLKGGRWESYPLGRLFFRHMRAVAFPTVYADEEARLQGKGKKVMEHVHIDPHFVHAYLYACAGALKMDAGVLVPPSSS